MIVPTLSAVSLWIMRLLLAGFTRRGLDSVCDFLSASRQVVGVCTPSQRLAVGGVA